MGLRAVGTGPLSALVLLSATSALPCQDHRSEIDATGATEFILPRVKPQATRGQE